MTERGESNADPARRETRDTDPALETVYVRPLHLGLRRPAAGSVDRVNSARVRRINPPLQASEAHDRLVALVRARLDRENAL
jgi:hypothetical protein